MSDGHVGGGGAGADGVPRTALAQFSDYDRATGGYVYNTRICDELAALGWDIDRLELPPGFPEPSPTALGNIADAIAAIPDGTPVLIDQVCLARIPAIAAAEARRLRWVDIFHHPMVCDLAADDPARAAVDARERTALDVAALVLATSPATERTLLEEYRVAHERLVMARPGLERFPAFPVRKAVRRSGPLRLLTVGAIVPRKGHGLLLEALSRVSNQAWRLDIVGNTDRDPDCVAAVLSAIDRLGLRDRVHLRGRLDDEALASLWADCDLYVSASRHEGYGMAIAEAIGRGVPVVTTGAGAVASWLDQAAAIIVDESEGAAQRDAVMGAIERLLAEPETRRRMGEAARRAAAMLPAWDDSARIVAEALQRLAVVRR